MPALVSYNHLRNDLGQGKEIMEFTYFEVSQTEIQLEHKKSYI